MSRTEEFEAGHGKAAPKPYVIITQHGEDRKVKRKRFGDADEAEAYARSMNPMTHGDLVPNVDEKFGKHKEYNQGFFWHGNRYAVMHHKGSDQYEW
jgi:hypothetical protein